MLLLVAATYEIKTSAVQSWVFSQFSRRLTYTVAPGPSDRIAFPREGPFNERLGYTRIPDYQRKLEASGYQVTVQTRFSPELLRLSRLGIGPPYREPSVTGLVIRSAQQKPIFSSGDSVLQFQRLEDVPPIIVNALLAIENRELADPADARRNPVLEWDRLAKAGLSYAGSKLGLPLRVEGGSTLATQIEKYRNSANGRTESPVDKLQQILGASLKVYRTGVDTRPQRHEIILEYLNTMPLSAAPGFGEVHGLGQGLLAWYGLQLADVRSNLSEGAPAAERARAVKYVVSLLASVRAPSTYLLYNHEGLAERTNFYVRLMAKSGVIDDGFASLVEATPLSFPSAAAVSLKAPTPGQKTANAIRTSLGRLIGVTSFYDLDRLHLTVATTIDADLQDRVLEVFQNLKDRAFLRAHGFEGERLLAEGDPAQVLYSLLLYEKTPQGNELRVQLDSLDRWFDINEGMKLELGSTAKLRTLAHYLDLVASLHAEFSALDRQTLLARQREARDPITRWAAETLQARPLTLDQFIEMALDRKYSASPSEMFFTGGGAHVFHNFDRKDNSRTMTLREATQRSTNLVFVRLMRDLVRFHGARLPYDAEAILADPQNPTRLRTLSEIADKEGRYFLLRAYQAYRGRTPKEIVSRLLGRRAGDPRRLAILFYAWQKPSGTEADKPALAAWIERFGAPARDRVPGLMRAYSNPRLTLADYSYLLGTHPLELWCAGQMIANPSLSWQDALARSAGPQKTASQWLFKTRNRRAQDLRLRIRIEQDAFERMTPDWKRLGFPFQRLVPSLATALGNSSDRPSALAELMGIIVNDGVRMPTVRMTALDFASGTPYQTRLEPGAAKGEPVLAPQVAHALKRVLAEVVERGTARRLAGSFLLPDGTRVVAGGKTGSGDNEFKAIGRRGGIISARQVNRTATFVFYVGNRYFGVLTAFVDGAQAARYSFTSALPVSILKVLAPSLNARLGVRGATTLQAGAPRSKGPYRPRG